MLFTTTGLLALRNSPFGRRTVGLIVAGCVIGSAIMIVLTVVLLHGSSVGLGTASIWTAILLLLTVVLIVLQILSLPAVTLQSIYGALSAYLIIGLMFASFYSAMSHLGGNAFFTAGDLSHGQTPDTTIFQYFSFTTLTTLGYGDFTAGTNAGRAVAVLEAVVGQIFLATLVARLVAAFRAPTQQSASNGASADADG